MITPYLTAYRRQEPSVVVRFRVAPRLVKFAQVGRGVQHDRDQKTRRAHSVAGGLGCAGSNPAAPMAGMNARRNYMDPVSLRWRAGVNPACRAMPGGGGISDALDWAKARCFSTFCHLGRLRGCVGTEDDRALEARGRKPVWVQIPSAALDETNADGSTCFWSPR